jgi:2-polyprenyl-3-methyl-5-hydroxy-6-metoxy-1,4-benzoquinol methylase
MSQKEMVVDGGVVAGNVYDKYGTRNPIARRLMRGFLGAFRDLVEVSGAREVHEVGCGEGRLAVELAELGLRVRASDFSPKIVEVARATVDAAAPAGTAIELRVASVYDLEPPGDSAELVVCCEVLEHLAEPREALRVLADLACPWALFSVPREPLWRVLNVVRGRYLRDLGNTPGHLQWWSRRSFVEMLAERFEVVAVRSPLPWTMVLCRASP